jgi:hypothetical protein
MKKEKIAEFIKEEWQRNPLPVESENATNTIIGIEQQINAGSKLILWMCAEDGTKVIKTIGVE